MAAREVLTDGRDVRSEQNGDQKKDRIGPGNLAPEALTALVSGDAP